MNPSSKRIGQEKLLQCSKTFHSVPLHPDLFIAVDFKLHLHSVCYLFQMCLQLIPIPAPDFPTAPLCLLCIQYLFSFFKLKNQYIPAMSETKTIFYQFRLSAAQKPFYDINRCCHRPISFPLIPRAATKHATSRSTIVPPDFVPQ